MANLVMVAGGLVVLVVLVDMLLTVLHPDVEGPLAWFVQRAIWKASLLGARAVGPYRRAVLSLAGPLLVVATFMTWAVVFVLGLSLVVWPNLEDYRSEPELSHSRPLGFIDAFYYSGVTVSVLGYGDITPTTGPLKVLAVAASGLGFAVLTGLVTYLVQVIQGIDERQRLALTVQDEAAGDRGATMLVRAAQVEGVAAARTRCDAWAALARAAEDKLHRLPLLAFVYRSSDLEHEPEPALRGASEAAVAALLLARRPGWEGLGPAADNLASAVARLQSTIAAQYFGKGFARELDRRGPEQQDHDRLRDIAVLLPGDGRSGALGEGDPALGMVARSRSFLAAVADMLGVSSADEVHAGALRS